MSYFSLPNMIDIDIALHPKELESCVEGMKQKRLKKVSTLETSLSWDCLSITFITSDNFEEKSFCKRHSFYGCEGHQSKLNKCQ